MPSPSRRSGPAPCDQCGETVIWAITAAGRWQPLNQAPDDEGSVLAWRDGLGAWRCRSVASVREVPIYGHERVHMPHAATCTGPRQLAMPSSVVPSNTMPSNVVPLARKKR